MPATITPAQHGARSIRQHFEPVQSSLDWLKRACPSETGEVKELLQSSCGPKIQSTAVDASSNGFVHGAIRAYNQHHHLRIRPEDVWFAILSQFSRYINAHAEELRGQFVTHEGKKELELTYLGHRYSVDFGLFAKQMSELIERNVVDPELRRWMMPSFTTTTKNDTVVASVLLMGTTKEYFSYTCHCECGLPSVTLLGDKADWELILTKIEKLKEYGREPTQFYDLLKPVLSRYVRSFDEPDSEEVASFWRRIAHYMDQGSGTTYYSGWITAFCFWDEKGRSKHNMDSLGDGKAIASRDDSGDLVVPHSPGEEVSWDDAESPVLELDGVTYYRIDSAMVPPGYTSVPVKLDDNGQVFEATMIAGSVGTKYMSSQGAGRPLDTIQPESGWWMYVKKAVR
ncbi:MAG: hypothetical protein Q9201_000244 [Fulgogasparrea decipioides]